MYSAHEYVVMSMHMVAPTSSAVIVSNGLCMPQTPYLIQHTAITPHITEGRIFPVMQCLHCK